MISVYPFSKENLVRENLILACIFVVLSGLFFCFVLCVCVKCIAYVQSMKCISGENIGC